MPTAKHGGAPRGKAGRPSGNDASNGSPAHDPDGRSGSPAAPWAAATDGDSTGHPALARGPMSRSRLDWVFLACILILAGVLRFSHLGRDGLWADEAKTATRAALTPEELLRHFRVEPEAPLPFLLVHPFLSRSGPNEWRVRIVFAVLGWLSVALIDAAGRRLISSRAGLMAAFLLAVNPLHVHYSREARNYSLLVFACLAALLASARLHERPTRRATVLAAICFLAVLSSHDIGVMYVSGIMAGFILLAAWRSDAMLLKRWGLAAALTAVGYLPWFSMLVSRAGKLGREYDWILPSWSSEFPWQVLRSLAALSHGSPAPVRNHVTSIHWTAWAGLALSALLITAGLGSRRAWRIKGAGPALAVSALWPLVFLFLYSCAVTPLYVVGRVDAAALPPLLLLVAAGAAGLSLRVKTLLVAGFAGLALQPVRTDVLVDFRSQERNIARLLAGEMRDGDSLIVTGFFRDAQVYYGGFWRPTVSVYSFPSDYELHTFWTAWSRQDPAGLEAEAATVAAGAIAGASRKGGRSVWLLMQRDPMNAVMVAELSRRLVGAGARDLRYLSLEYRRYDLTATPGATPAGRTSTRPP